jgi:hypothetical protein
MFDWRVATLPILSLAIWVALCYEVGMAMMGPRREC